MNCPQNNLIVSYHDYVALSSLFKDFEIIDKTARKHLDNNDFLAVIRCLNIMRLILDELKQHTLK